jgi:hypothetical protein
MQLLIVVTCLASYTYLVYILSIYIWLHTAFMYLAPRLEFVFFKVKFPKPTELLEVNTAVE